MRYTLILLTVLATIQIANAVQNYTYQEIEPGKAYIYI